MARQGTSPEALALLIEEILLELSGALNGIIAELGLSSSTQTHLQVLFNTNSA